MDSHELYLRKQVTSLDLARRLCELGVPQRSIFFWQQDRGDWHPVMKPSGVSQSGNESGDRYSAFIPSELGALLPSEVIVYKRRIAGRWQCESACSANDTRDSTTPSVCAATMSDALAKMLMYILEHETVKLQWKARVHPERKIRGVEVVSS